MKKRYIYLLIIVVSIISIFPLIIKSNVWGHDTNFHLANIEDITNNISFTNPLPKISTDIGNGLGYATHLFYAPLPHYLGGYLNLIFRLLNIGVDKCLVFIYLIISILSGMIMYHFSYEILKKKSLAITSTIIYLLMPYRMGDMIVRSSMNEVFIFLFIPMILLSLNRLINNKKYLLLFVVGYTGLILSHLVMALYTTLFLIIWALLFYKDILKKENIIKLIKGVLLVTIFVLPFLSLLLSQKLGSNYLIFQNNYMSNIDYMNYFSMNLKDYLIPLNNYSWDVPLFINILVIISSIISIYFFFKEKKKKGQKDKNIIYLIVLTILCIIMTLNIFPWEFLPGTLYMIQFPWRLQTFTTISISIIAPMWINKLDKKKVKNATILFISLLIITTIPFIMSMMKYEFIIPNTIDYNNGMGHSKEYLPTRTYENIEYFENKKVEIKCYNCTSKIIKNTSKKLTFDIKTLDEQVIEIPRLYYIGYKLKDNNNKKIKFYENENGFIEFIGNNDTYTLTYDNPTIYKITIILSSITFLVIINYQIYNYSKKKFRK